MTLTPEQLVDTLAVAGNHRGLIRSVMALTWDAGWYAAGGGRQLDDVNPYADVPATLCESCRAELDRRATT